MLMEYILIAYILLFISFIVFLTVRVKIKTGVFPIIRNVAGTYGFTDKIVSLTYLLMILNTIVFVSGVRSSPLFELIHYLHYYEVQVIGMVVIGFALLLMFIAQLQMKDSWRIGIDKENDTELVNSGLFKYLRHPIYFFAIIIGVGTVLVIPSIASIFIFILLYIILSIQSRLEEEFMLTKFEDKYREFMKSHKRFF